MAAKNKVSFILPFYAKAALILISIVLLFIILQAASGLLIPILFAVLVAILLLQPATYMERNLKMGRFLSSLLSVICFLAILGGFLHFLALQLTIFINDLPQLQSRFLAIFEDVQKWVSRKLHITTTQQSEYISGYFDKLLEHAGGAAKTVFFSLSGALLSLVIVFLFSFFILYYRRLLMRFVTHLFSVDNRNQVSEVVGETRTMINAYVAGLVIEMLIVGLVTAITFMIMDVHYAMLLAILIAVLNVIPYFGFYSALALAMLVSFANNALGGAIEVAIAAFTIHLLDSNVLYPRLIGGRVKMNPFVTVLAVVLGQYVWGVAGMFLAVPIVSVLKMVCDRVERLQAWSILMSSGDD